MKSKQQILERLEKEKIATQKRREAFLSLKKGFSGRLNNFISQTEKLVIAPEKELELVLVHWDDPEGIHEDDCREKIRLWKEKREKLFSSFESVEKYTKHVPLLWAKFQSIKLQLTIVFDAVIANYEWLMENNAV